MKKAACLESTFQKQVIAFAAIHGWRTAHFRPGLTKSGRWTTAVQGDGAGFPDLVLVRERVVWAELKSDKGTMSDEQKAWVAALVKAGCEVYVWRPGDWDEVVEVLAGSPAKCSEWC